MALIKGSEAGGMAGHRSLTLHDLKEQAERVLADAAAEAQRIVDQARSEAQAKVEAATRRGFAEGRDRGHVEGREAGVVEGRAEVIETFSAQLRATLTAWSEMLTDWETRRLAMLAAAREDVLMLALAMGEKVAHRIIEVDPAVVVDILLWQRLYTDPLAEYNLHRICYQLTSLGP